jgi:hypothetical protein
MMQAGQGIFPPCKAKNLAILGVLQGFFQALRAACGGCAWTRLRAQ